MKYIHFNPEKHGFINDYTKWKHSSYRNYYLDDNAIININMEGENVYKRKIPN